MNNYEMKKETARRFLRPAEFAEVVGISLKRCQNLLSARQIPGQVRIPHLGWRIDFQKFAELCEENIFIPKSWE